MTRPIFWTGERVNELAFERQAVSTFCGFGARVWSLHGVHLPELSAHHQGLQLLRYCTANRSRARRVFVGRLLHNAAAAPRNTFD